MSLASHLPPGLPPDIFRAAESLEQPNETFYDNEEELALVSLLCARGDMDSLELALKDSIDNNGASADQDVPGDDNDDGRGMVLLADLEWYKKCGNGAFQAEDWMGALEQYARLLKYNSSLLKRETYESCALLAYEDLMVTVRANTAQVLLNLARNEEAAEQCEEVLKLPILFNKPALHKKVLHRLEQSRKPPSMKARLAAADCKRQIQALEPTVTITEETQISICEINEGECEAVEYAFKIAQGDLAFSSMLLSICRRNPDVDSVLKLARSFFLDGGHARLLERGEILHLMELLGLGEQIAKQKAEQAQAQRTGEDMLEQVVKDCQEKLWNECMQKNTAQTTELLTQPREWLSSHDRRRAIPYFLFAADRIANIPIEEEKVAKNSIAYQANKPNAVRSLRAIVEGVWFQYVGAMRQLDLADYGRTEGESYNARWEDVELERMRHKLRLVRGTKEPEHTSDIPPKPSNVAECSLQTASMFDSTKQGSYVPSLEDLTAYRIQRQAQVAAVQRGLKILRKAEADKDEYSVFDLQRFVSDVALKKQAASMKKTFKGTPPVVDKLWHLCYQEKQGITAMMVLEHHSIQDVKESRPPCVFVTNRTVACPPPESREMRFLRKKEVKELPKSTLAVQYLPIEERGESIVDDIQRVLLKSVKARGGIPGKIAIGPVGARKLSRKYLHSHDGGPPTEMDLSAVNNEDDKYYCERSRIEAFIEDTLQVKEQWIEGILGELPSYRFHEERPQKKTPAESRSQYLKEMNA